MIALWGHILGSAVIGWLPRRAWYRVADVLLGVALLGWPGHVRRAERNMRRVLGRRAPEQEVRARTRLAFRNYARYMVDLLWLSGSNHQDRNALLTRVNWRHIDEARARGKGLLIVTGHIGNWDLPAAVLAGTGVPVNVIVETLQPPAWNARVQAIRERIGMQAIPMERGLREVYAALERNEVVAVLFDRPVTRGGVPVTYFGRETRVPEGVARIALRTGAAVVGAAGIRRGDCFIAEVSPPFQVQRTGDRDRDVQALTQVMVDWLEGVVRQYPSQWFMFREFWPSARN